MFEIITKIFMKMSIFVFRKVDAQINPGSLQISTQKFAIKVYKSKLLIAVSYYSHALHFRCCGSL